MTENMVVPRWQHPYPKPTQLDAFRRYINLKYKLSLRNYKSLHKWSVDNVELFNAELWERCGLAYSVPPERVAYGFDKLWPPPKWFPGARLNYSENLLATGLASRPDSIAISACREGGTDWRHLSWKELEQQVQLYAFAMTKAGVQEGDRVAAVVTNSVESVVLLLATGWIGAIFSSTSPDMGPDSIVERFVQIKPKVLFIESNVLYAAKRLDLRSKLALAIRKLNDTYPGGHTAVDISNQSWRDTPIISLNQFLNVEVVPMQPVQVPFDHPIYILYSSGTTGAPKCICHGGGQALLQQKKEFIFVLDLGLDSSFYQYTTAGWMMWNYLLGALSVGSRIVLYDGSPMHPTPARQIEILQEQGVTHWGTSPKFLTGLKQSDYMKSHDLESLQMVSSAGSPLSVEIFNYFYTWAPPQVPLFSGSGGTDLVASILGGSPLSSVYAGEIANATLGMKLEIFNTETGRPVEPGQIGELVVTKPFLSMPITFWGEGGMEKYRKAYFDQFPGIWCHGDLIKQNPVTGGYEILGRSDGVLNPGGVRFGTAEIYGILDKFPEVEDYLAVGQRLSDDSDEQVLLFLKMKELCLNDVLRSRLALAIKTQLSARHVPAHMIEVEEIPITSNGKRVENAVKNIVNGDTSKVGGAVINPECLKEYSQYTQLANVNKAKL